MENLEMKYKAKKSKSFGIYLLIIGLVIIFVSMIMPIMLQQSIESDDLLISLSIVFPVLGLMLWLWFGTLYIIKDEVLYVISGPMRWKILISDIQSIWLNQKTIGAVIRPTLSWNSMAINYKNNRSIYITPQQQEDFINQLRIINEAIEVK